MVSAAVIADAEADRLLAALADLDAAVLAVSGGADSMALMLLAREWARRRDACQLRSPELLVATVDHGLRAGSADEAGQVGVLAARLGLAHVVLHWAGCKPATGLQEQAREARYALLAGLVAARFPAVAGAAVVTAHTLEDQSETLLMRLARGSGVDGLAAIGPEATLSGVKVMRPLLAVSHRRLVATLRAAGIGWIEDPSNDMEAFERVRLRRARATLDALGLTPGKVSLSAARLRRAREALEWQGRAEYARLADEHSGTYVSIARSGFEALPEELCLRLLNAGLECMRGASPVPRLAAVEAMCDALASGHVGDRTLGGCIVELARDAVRIYREPGRAGLPTLELVPGDWAVWDARFKVRVAAGVADRVTVRAVGEDFARLRKEAPSARMMPFRGGRCLPAFCVAGQLVAVPSLDWSEGDAAARFGREVPLFSVEPLVRGSGARV
jgi:tRNA(Ile)-lysidine synthase